MTDMVTPSEKNLQFAMEKSVYNYQEENFKRKNVEVEYEGNLNKTITENSISEDEERIDDNLKNENENKNLENRIFEESKIFGDEVKMEIDEDKFLMNENNIEKELFINKNIKETVDNLIELPEKSFKIKIENEENFNNFKGEEESIANKNIINSPERQEKKNIIKFESNKLLEAIKNSKGKKNTNLSKLMSNVQRNTKNKKTPFISNKNLSIFETKQNKIQNSTEVIPIKKEILSVNGEKKENPSIFLNKLEHKTKKLEGKKEKSIIFQSDDQNFSIDEESSNLLNLNSISLNSNIELEEEEDNTNKSNKTRKKKIEGLYKTGRWTTEEHKCFLEAIFLFANNWKKVQQHIKTRSSTQARSHAQKFFISLKKKISDNIDPHESDTEDNERKINQFLFQYVDDIFVKKIYGNNFVERDEIFNERKEKICLLIQQLLSSNPKTKRSFFKCIESKDRKSNKNIVKKIRKENERKINSMDDDDEKNFKSNIKTLSIQNISMGDQKVSFETQKNSDGNLNNTNNVNNSNNLNNSNYIKSNNKLLEKPKNSGEIMQNIDIHNNVNIHLNFNTSNFGNDFTNKNFSTNKIFENKNPTSNFFYNFDKYNNNDSELFHSLSKNLMNYKSQSNNPNQKLYLSQSYRQPENMNINKYISKNEVSDKQKNTIEIKKEEIKSLSNPLNNYKNNISYKNFNENFSIDNNNHSKALKNKIKTNNLNNAIVNIGSHSLACKDNLIMDQIDSNNGNSSNNSKNTLNNLNKGKSILNRSNALIDFNNDSNKVPEYINSMKEFQDKNKMSFTSNISNLENEKIALKNNPQIKNFVSKSEDFDFDNEEYKYLQCPNSKDLNFVKNNSAATKFSEIIKSPINDMNFNSLNLKNLNSSESQKNLLGNRNFISSFEPKNNNLNSFIQYDKNKPHLPSNFDINNFMSNSKNLEDLAEVESNIDMRSNIGSKSKNEDINDKGKNYLNQSNNIKEFNSFPKILFLNKKNKMKPNLVEGNQYSIFKCDNNVNMLNINNDFESGVKKFNSAIINPVRDISEKINKISNKQNIKDYLNGKESIANRFNTSKISIGGIISGNSTEKSLFSQVFNSNLKSKDLLNQIQKNADSDSNKICSLTTASFEAGENLKKGNIILKNMNLLELNKNSLFKDVSFNNNSKLLGNASRNMQIKINNKTNNTDNSESISGNSVPMEKSLQINKIVKNNPFKPNFSNNFPNQSQFHNKNNLTNLNNLNIKNLIGQNGKIINHITDSMGIFRNSSNFLINENCLRNYSNINSNQNLCDQSYLSENNTFLDNKNQIPQGINYENQNTNNDYTNANLDQNDTNNISLNPHNKLIKNSQPAKIARNNSINYNFDDSINSPNTSFNLNFINNHINNHKINNSTNNNNVENMMNYNNITKDELYFDDVKDDSVILNRISKSTNIIKNNLNLGKNNKELRDDYLNPFNLNFNVEEDKLLNNPKNEIYSFFNHKEEDEFLGFDNYSI